jgi:hypothetical protein
MTSKRRSLNEAHHRDQPKLIASFLNEALATGDTVAFVKAIGDVTRAQGMTKVAQKTGLKGHQNACRAPIRDCRKADRPILNHSSMTDRPQKITFAEMRDMGVRGC